MFRALASVADINWKDKSCDLLFLLGDKREGWTYEHNPLVLVILHPAKYKNVYSAGKKFFDEDKKYYSELLGFAPANGPTTDNTISDYHPYWSSSSRLNWPNNKGNRNSKKPMEYAGMDYMFLYNLYRLVFEPNNYTLPTDRRNELKTKSASKYPVPEMNHEGVQYYYMPPVISKQ
jgi:hypothetical protein